MNFQKRVQEWLMACFSMEICRDTIERNHRFLEESLELVQSLGCTASEAHQLVDYVYGRPVGEPAQEVGGVMNTLAALCSAADLDLEACGETELARVWTKIDKIRAKQAAKPKHSPLPEHVPAHAQGARLPGNLAHLSARLQHAMTTMQNDDLSEPGTDKRLRHVARYEAMADVLAALRAPEAADAGAVAEAIGDLRHFSEHQLDRNPRMQKIIATVIAAASPTDAGMRERAALEEIAAWTNNEAGYGKAAEIAREALAPTSTELKSGGQRS